MKQILAQRVTVKKPEFYGGNLEDLITTIINVVLWVVGVAVVIYLIYGGIIYITAGGDAEKAAKGRVAITNAIIGLVIVIAALAIYNFVIREIVWVGGMP